MGEMAMLSEVDAATLASILLGLGVFLGLTGAFAFRARRIRAAVLRLALPVSEVAELRARKRGRPRWLKKLPKDLALPREGTLFDALYRHHGVRPRGRIPAALGSALEPASGRRGELASLLPENAPMSDDERIKSLLSAPTDAAVAPPSDAVTQNFVLNLVNVFRGRKKLRDGLEHAVLDSLAPGGGFAGAKLGGAVGLALAPLVVGLSTVFVPASVAAGAWLGAWTGKKVGTQLKARRYYALLKRLRVVSRDFQRWFVDRFPEFLRDLDAEYAEARRELHERTIRHQSRIGRFWSPDLVTVFHRQAAARLREDRAADRKRFKHVFAAVRAQDPLDCVSVLDRMDAHTLESHPGFVLHRQAYRAALKDFADLRKQAS